MAFFVGLSASFLGSLVSTVAGSAPARLRWKFVAVMAVIFSIVGIFAFGFTTDPKLVRSPLVKKLAPGFSVTRMGGTEEFSMAKMRGTPLVLNFWASWCVACREEAHVLQAAHLRYEKKEEKIRVIGIAIQDTEAAAMAFAKRFGKTYFLALDNASGDISLNYGLYGVPETFFIDAQGRVAYKHVGAVTPELMLREVTRLIAASGEGDR